MLEASTSDPVARVTILSAGGGVMDVTETTVVRRCLNPIWNAAFSFEIQHGEVYQNGQSAMLHITIEDWDALSNNDVLGHIVVPVSSLQSLSLIHI